jgi:hypothetical protein
METMAVPEDMLCQTMTSPLVMPFVWGILFGMWLPGELARDSGSMLSGTSLLFEGHTVVYLILNVGITEGKFIILL